MTTTEEGSGSGGTGAPSIGTDGVNVMEAFGNFVLNVKVLSSEAGSGVPTLPVRVPQIVDYADSYEHPRLSFSKLIDIVIMIASSQQPSTTVGGGSTKVQHHVLLSFPNPQTKNSVMISSSEELLQVMERYQDQHQLTLIAKVQQEIVKIPKDDIKGDKKAEEGNKNDDERGQEKDGKINIVLPEECTFTNKKNVDQKEDIMVTSTLDPVTPDRRPVVARAVLLEGDDINDEKKLPHTPETLPVTPASPDSPLAKAKKRQSDLEPVHFQLPNHPVATLEEDPPVTASILTSFMEQLLDIQSQRMQDFADRIVEDAIQNCPRTPDTIVTSEFQLRKCLQETVQIMNDENNSTDGSNDPSDNTSPVALEKIVKDQMVSMELRFAKLEEQQLQQSVQSAAIKCANKSETAHGKTVEELNHRLEQMEAKMDQRFESLEHLMILLRQDAEYKNATLNALALSPARLSRQPILARRASTGSTGSKPPLPPHHQGRSIIGSTPPPEMVVSLPAFLPRMAPFSFHLPPVSQSVLSTPLPPSIPSSPRPESVANPRPPSPVTVPAVANQMRPVSPPPTERTSNTTLPHLAPLTPSPPSSPPGSSSATRSASTSAAILEDDDEKNGTGSVEDNENEKEDNGIIVDGVPIVAAASEATALSMPSLGHDSPSSPLQRKKESVRGLFMTANSLVSDPGSEIQCKSLPIQLPMLDASARDTSAFSPSTPPASNSFSEVNKTASGNDHDSHPARSSERKMKKAIKDHMDSMESRVSRIREINRRASTPSMLSGALSTTMDASSSESSSRVLFSTAPNELETTLFEKLDTILESLHSCIQSKTRESLDLKLGDIERKLEEMKETLEFSANGNSSQKRGHETMVVLQESIDRRMDSLESLVQAATTKLEAQDDDMKKNGWLPLRHILQELSINPPTSEGQKRQKETDPVKVDTDGIFALQDALDRRMDTIESLVQLTATELEFSTKESQKRLHLSLVDQILDILGPWQQQTCSGIDDAGNPNSNSNSTGKASSSSDDVHSIGENLVIADREESVQATYGEIEIDDMEESITPDRKSLQVVGRGMSLRDVCDIDTIEEGNEIDNSARSEGTDEMVKKHNESISSELLARSASVKNIYGDMDIDALSGHGTKEKSSHDRLDSSPKNILANNILRTRNAPAVTDAERDVSLLGVQKAKAIGAVEAEGTASNIGHESSNINEGIRALAIHSGSGIDGAISSPERRDCSSEFVAEDSSHCASSVSIDDGPPEMNESPEDIYDNLSIDGAESGCGSLVDVISISTEDWDDVDALSTNMDEDYDSESSGEDDAYFNDHDRQFLVVLASAMGKIRAAKKGTVNYRKYEEGIFAAKRPGPLAMKVKSVAVYDATDVHEAKMTDDSLVGDESDIDEVSAPDQNDQSCEHESFGTPSVSSRDEGAGYTRERARENALTMARAVAKRRATDRGMKNYRRLLDIKFTPKARRGPLALADNSDAPEVWDENVASDSSNSNIYTEDSKEATPIIGASVGDKHSDGYFRDPDDDNAKLQRAQPNIDSFPSGSNPDSSASDEHCTSDLPEEEQTIGKDSYTSKSGNALEVGKITVSQPEVDIVTNKEIYWVRGGQNNAHDTEDGSTPTGFTQSIDVDPSKIAAESDGGNLEAAEATPRKPVYAVFDEDGDMMGERELEHRSDMAVLFSTQPIGSTLQENNTEVWESVAGRTSQEDLPAVENSLLSRQVHNAEYDAENGAVKPENTRDQYSPASQEGSSKPFDESEGNLFEPVAEVVQQTRSFRFTPTEENSNEIELEEKEMEEWEAIASWRQSTAERKDKQVAEDQNENEIPETPAPEVVDAVEHVLLLNNLNDMKTQMKSFEDLFLASHSGIQASNDLWKSSNENLRNAIFESIEDSHHFAAYLDKMLSDKIGQLEEAIYTQTLLASQSLLKAAGQQGGSPHRQNRQNPGITPPRARSAPTSPAHVNWSTARRPSSRSTNPFDENESKESESNESRDITNSMVVTLTEWKRLQDQLRGTEEVAEAYRKQVLQLRNVLETKINEGNASLHRVEVLKRKLDDAHDREVQAQKQLRPVTRRVEQVIQEMVELEEQSASLQLENGMLREQLWKAQREC